MASLRQLRSPRSAQIRQERGRWRSFFLSGEKPQILNLRWRSGWKKEEVHVGMPAKVDLEKCDGCGTCAEECPVECITIVEEGDRKYAVVNEEECTDCETCVDACEKGAITVEVAEEG